MSHELTSNKRYIVFMLQLCVCVCVCGFFVCCIFTHSHFNVNSIPNPIILICQSPKIDVVDAELRYEFYMAQCENL